MYTGQKCSNHLVDFYDLPGSRPDSMIFQAWKLSIFNSMYFPGSVHILSKGGQHNLVHIFTKY